MDPRWRLCGGFSRSTGGSLPSVFEPGIHGVGTWCFTAFERCGRTEIVGGEQPGARPPESEHTRASVIPASAHSRCLGNAWFKTACRPMSRCAISRATRVWRLLSPTQRTRRATSRCVVGSSLSPSRGLSNTSKSCRRNTSANPTPVRRTRPGARDSVHHAREDQRQGQSVSIHVSYRFSRAVAPAWSTTSLARNATNLRIKSKGIGCLSKNFSVPLPAP